jgi:hypothetical protein
MGDFIHAVVDGNRFCSSRRDRLVLVFSKTRPTERISNMSFFHGEFWMAPRFSSTPTLILPRSLFCDIKFN